METTISGLVLVPELLAVRVVSLGVYLCGPVRQHFLVLAFFPGLLKTAGGSGGG